MCEVRSKLWQTLVKKKANSPITSIFFVLLHQLPDFGEIFRKFETLLSTFQMGRHWIINNILKEGTRVDLYTFNWDLNWPLLPGQISHSGSRSPRERGRRCRPRSNVLPTSGCLQRTIPGLASWRREDRNLGTSIKVCPSELESFHDFCQFN